MEYREIIREQVRNVVLKKEKAKEKDVHYWEWILKNLIEDLRDYETEGRERWSLEPLDDAWKKYSRTRTPESMKSVDEIFNEILKRFFGEEDSFF